MEAMYLLADCAPIASALVKPNIIIAWNFVKLLHMFLTAILREDEKRIITPVRINDRAVGRSCT